MSRSVVYSSPFVPAEWIAAHGLEPVRLVPEAAPAADTLQGTCPFAADFARSAMQAEAAAGIVLTSTCDQMRRMAERLARRSRTPVFLMNVPATWGRAGSDLYTAELRRLGDFLVALGGTGPSRETLIEQMRTCDARRRRQAVARSSESLSASDAVRLGLVGGPLRRQDLWIFDLLDELGAQVVLDATETGERCQPAPFEETLLENDPLAELTRAYFATIPDVCRRPDTHLHDYLRLHIARRSVQGLVLVRYLWCDQWHAQGGRLKETMHLPLVQIDLGDQDHQLQRTRTRLETLVSILR